MTVVNSTVEKARQYIWSKIHANCFMSTILTKKHNAATHFLNAAIKITTMRYLITPSIRQ